MADSRGSWVNRVNRARIEIVIYLMAFGAAVFGVALAGGAAGAAGAGAPGAGAGTSAAADGANAGAVDGRPAATKRYLSVYANDVTSSLQGYSDVKAVLERYIVAWKNHNMKALKRITSPELFQALNSSSRSYRSTLVPSAEIEDLAIYEYKGRTFAQFDVRDPVSKKVESLKSWFEVQAQPQNQNQKRRWIISAIHEHFDPDAGP